MKYARPLLAMNMNLVLFVDEKAREFIENERRERVHMTQINVITLQDLDYYKEYERMKEIMASEEFKKDNPFLNHPEGFSPEYNVMMNSKLALVHQTAGHNPFNTTHFYWLDIGYGHGKDMYPKSKQWAPINIMNLSGKITYISLHNVSRINNIYNIYKKYYTPMVSGGFFGGTRKALDKYHDLYRKVFEHFMDSNMMDDDQTVTLECYLRDPELFNMVPGSWFDAFKLFH